MATTTEQRKRRIAVALGIVTIVGFLSACTPATQPTQTRERHTLASCDSIEPPSVAPRTIDVDGRASLLYAPVDYTPGVAYPLLVSLHPFLLGPQAWESYSGLAAAASARNYWVLLPRGSDPGPRWAVPGGLAGGPDDIGWIDQLIERTAATVCVDGSRVFAAGFSAGAAMAVGLSCELPWRFAAIAASGGSNLTSLCPDAGPTDALILHGSADPIAPSSGSTVVFAPPLGLSVDDVIATFAERNHCRAKPRVVQRTATVTVEHYRCEHHRLDYWRELGAGHTWAGANVSLDAVTGPTDHSLSATTAVLDYFDAS